MAKNDKIKTTIIDRFDGGMTNASRSKDARFSRNVVNFDILSALNRMAPNPGMEADGFGGALTKAVCRLSKLLPTNDLIYALGTVSAADASPQIYERSTPTVNWTATTTGGQASSGDISESLFIEYQGAIFGGRKNGSATGAPVTDGTHLWKHTISPAAFNITFKALTFDTIYQGLVHTKDDILYIPYTTVSNGVSTGYIAKYDGSSWNDTALTLPKNQIPVSICEYGNALAIACKPKYKGGKSILYIWDRDASLATLSEKALWGDESLELIQELNGSIIGISTTAASGMNNLVVNLNFKQWYSGLSGPLPILKIPLSSLAISFNGIQKTNDRLYFMMSAKIRGTQYDGIFTFGKLDNWSFSMDRLINNDTAITSAVLKGFLIYGDWVLANFTDSGAYTAMRTQSSGPYSEPTSTYESLIFNNGDSDIKKKLIKATVMFEPLPTAGTVDLDYKIDAESAWTTIFTGITVDNAISHRAVNIESNGNNLPEYNEIQFRIKSTNNAVITGLKFTSEIIDKGI